MADACPEGIAVRDVAGLGETLVATRDFLPGETLFIEAAPALAVPVAARHDAADCARLAAATGHATAAARAMLHYCRLPAARRRTVSAMFPGPTPEADAELHLATAADVLTFVQGAPAARGGCTDGDGPAETAAAAAAAAGDESALPSTAELARVPLWLTYNAHGVEVAATGLFADAPGAAVKYFALYPIGCKLTHSCAPNTARVSVAGAPAGLALRHVVLGPVRGLRRGDVVTTAYLGDRLAWSAPLRRAFLRATKAFRCTCARCAAEDAHASATGADVPAVSDDDPTTTAWRARVESSLVDALTEWTREGEAADADAPPAALALGAVLFPPTTTTADARLRRSGHAALDAALAGCPDVGVTGAPVRGDWCSWATAVAAEAVAITEVPLLLRASASVASLRGGAGNELASSYQRLASAAAHCWTWLQAQHSCPPAPAAAANTAASQASGPPVATDFAGGTSVDTFFFQHVFLSAGAAVPWLFDDAPKAATARHSLGIPASDAAALCTACCTTLARLSQLGLVSLHAEALGNDTRDTAEAASSDALELLRQVAGPRCRDLLTQAAHGTFAQLGKAQGLSAQYRAVTAYGLALATFAPNDTSSQRRGLLAMRANAALFDPARIDAALWAAADADTRELARVFPSWPGLSALQSRCPPKPPE